MNAGVDTTMPLLPSVNPSFPAPSHNVNSISISNSNDVMNQTSRCDLCGGLVAAGSNSGASKCDSDIDSLSDNSLADSSCDELDVKPPASIGRK